MAFFSKVGNILKQTASQQSLELFVFKPSIYQAIRCMSTKVFVGGVSYNMDENSLREAFSKYGEVVEARVIMDRETGRSRGFGFVTYTSSEEASSAIQALDGQELHGRQVRVNYANERQPRPSGGGYGGGGGYGDGGYGSGGGYGGGGGGYRGRGNYNNNNFGVDNYGSGGGGGIGGNYGGSGGGYGGGSYAGGNTYDSGSSGGFGTGNFGVAGGGGGNSFADSGFDGSTELGFGGGVDQYGSNESSSSMGDGAGGFSQEVPLEGNYRDDDEPSDDYAKRA